MEKKRKVAEKKKEIQKERKLVKEMEEEEVVQGQYLLEYFYHYSS